MIAFKNALIFDSDSRSFFKGGMVVENGVIAEYAEREDGYDLGENVIIPGLVDIHTHGRNGVDFNQATLEEMKALKKYYAEKGVTTVIPTLASDTLQNMLRSVELIKEAGFKGAHIEGRYLNLLKKGAHAPGLLSPLDPDEIGMFADAAGGIHLHFSAAYELDDGKFLAEVLSKGYTASLGHTNATYAEAEDCIKRGVSSFTHLFNTMPPIHHRAGGCVAAALTSDAYVEIICDGLHLAPETVKLVKTAKTPDKVILITDSMMGTGCSDGEYSIAGNPVCLKDGKAYTPDGALAGSTLELMNGVKNYLKFTGAPLADAVAAATVNPATMLGIDAGTLKIGSKADFLILSPNLEVKNVYLGGERV